VAGALASLRSPLRPRLSSIYAFIVLYTGYIVAIGGDAFYGSRFFVPIVPLLSVLLAVGFANGVERLTQPAARRATTAAFLTIYGASCLSVMVRLSQQWRLWKELEIGAVPLIADMSRRTPANEPVAAIGIGLLKFKSDLRVIDMLGLTDRHIARHPVTPD